MKMLPRSRSKVLLTPNVRIFEDSLKDLAETLKIQEDPEKDLCTIFQISLDKAL